LKSPIINQARVAPVKTNQAIHRHMPRKKALFNLAGTIIAAISSILLIYNIVAYQRYYNLIAEYKKKIKIMETDLPDKKGDSFPQMVEGLGKQEKQNIINNINFVNRLIYQDVFPWCNLLAALEKKIPDNMDLTGFIPYDNFSKITITGKTDHAKKITAFLKNMEKSELFQGSMLTQLGMTKKNQPEGSESRTAEIYFEIKALLQTDIMFSEKKYGSFGTCAKKLLIH